ncbi:MAG: hypothetical protein J5714_00010 [Alphaproteobacteria bacterium]|nr:hypothetical protein [Alphaproteobacteria bacterium]
MAQDMKEFLLNYYKQRHFDLMSPEVRAQFNVYRDRNDFTGNMKHWNKELLDDTGKNKPVPELTEDADLEKLYNLFQDVLQDMAANKDDFKYETASTDFLSTWFGGTKALFDYSKATKEAEQDIAKVRAVLSNPKYKNQVSVFLRNYFTDDFTIDDLISGTDPKEKQYNSDPKFRERMLNVIKYIQAYQEYGNEYWPQEARIIFSNPDTEKWFKSDLFDAKRFKNAYPKMLDALLTSKKLRDRFAQYGTHRTISNQLTKAIEQTNYEDENSDDFVRAKIPDAKNIAQRLSDWKDDTYENIFRKFQTARGSRIYFTEYSREIIKAIDKAGIKPTDGIDGLISKHTEIEDKLATKSPTAKKHFGWFASTMENIKKTMPKAYEKGLRNGRSLRAVVSEVIRIAIRDSKVDEAKTALEILSVCKYGFMTSKAVEDLNAYFKENKEGIFSNKELSWNKSEGVKFVTGALDKTMRFGLKATVQSVATLNHMIQKSRTKFNGHKGVKIKGKWSLGADIDTNTAKMQDAKSRGIQIAQDTIDSANIDIKKNTDMLDIMGGINPKTKGRSHPVGTKNPETKSGLDITSANIDNLTTVDLPALEKNRKDAKDDLDTKVNYYNIAKKKYTEEKRNAVAAEKDYNEPSGHYNTLKNAVKQLDMDIAKLESKLSSLGGSPKDFAEANFIYSQIKDLHKEKDEKNIEIADLENTHNAYVKKGSTGYSQYDLDIQLEQKFNDASKNLSDAQKKYDDAQTKYTNLEADINEYNDMVGQNGDLQTAIDSQQDIINNWDRDHVDKYAELMSYWDTLESPSKVHSFRIATNKIRDQMTERQKKSPLGKEITMTNAQWMAWEALQNYKHAA